MTVAYKIAQKDSRKKLKEGELNSFVANLSTDVLLGLTSLTILLNLFISESGSEVMIRERVTFAWGELVSGQCQLTNSLIILCQFNLILGK
ncbi:MAG: hypothetical protein WBM32_02715 [Crocosphaera sp.]